LTFLSQYPVTTQIVGIAALTAVEEETGKAEDWVVKINRLIISMFL
jgi:hypothetical protein